MPWWLLGFALLVLILAGADAATLALWAILALFAWRLAHLEAMLADLRQRLGDGPAPPPAVPRPAAPPPLELDEDLVASLASTAGAPRAVAPDWLGRGLGAARRFFTEGNAPVKVGLLVLLAGIGALLDYAADQDWLRFPPAWRLLALAGVALAGLGLGWHQRRQRPIFALALQGGAIGALYLILFAALRLYQLVGPGPAFAGFVALAVLGLGLAVRQSAQPVAAFAVLGGLAAPLLASTGSGSHVVLFGFYAVLNAVVFAAAWWRAWRVLNLIGFIATFIVGLAWGHSYYAPAYFATVEPFLVLFFLFYVAVGLLYARHRPTPRGWWVDATLVFGTPLLAFGLQVALLAGADRPLALSAAAVALLHAALAGWLWRRPGATTLATSYALLAAGFAAVAVPLAYGASWTHGVWALEGLAVLWLGRAQARPALPLAGATLMLAAGVAWVGHWLLAGAGEAGARLSGAVAIVVAAWAGTYLLDRDGARRWLAPLLFASGWVLFVLAGLDQIHVHLGGVARLHALALLAALAAALAAAAGLGLRWPRAQAAAAGALVAGAGVAPLAVLAGGLPLATFGSWVWLGYAAALVILCRVLPLSLTPQATGWFALALVASAELFARVPGGLDAGLAVASAGLPWLALAGVAWRAPSLLACRSGAAPAAGERPLALAFGGGLAAWLVGSAASAGWVAAMPFVPLVNPLEAVQLVSLWLLWQVAVGAPVGVRGALERLVLALGLLVVTAATLRGVHQLADVPWSWGLWHERLAQAALAIVWTALGIGAMLIGAHRMQRPVWVGGAALAGVVIVKLLLVDRHYLGDLPGIVAFLGVGGLLVAVGYFAPVPLARRAGPPG